jgi:Skp family chaperone for outer membrane proteins
MKTFVIPVIVLAALVSVAAAQQPDASFGTRRIGYVSMQQVLSETTEAKAAAEQLKATQQQKAGELRARQQALDETRRQLGEPAAMFQGKRLRQQEERQRAELEQATVQAQQEFQTLQLQIQRELRARLKFVLDELSKRHRLEVVLNHDTSVLWAAPGLDLTSAVIERLNATVPPAPKPAS